jgi:hypothetical protein
MGRLLPAFLVSLIVALMGSPATAHVPYFERTDYTEEKPFKVKDSVENSKAVYAWFETGSDIDVYTFEVKGPVRVHVEALVPVCSAYEELRPSFAVVGPGLPSPTRALPFTIPEGYGAVVVKAPARGGSRSTFYEPFGAKSYYDGSAFDRRVSAPGTWYVYYWNPDNVVGDYVAVLGYKERFSLSDAVRALINTPQIWFDRELHMECH